MQKRWAAVAGALCGIVLAAGAQAKCYRDTYGGDSTCEVLNQATQAVALTPSDSADIAATKGLYIGDATACNVAAIFRNGSSAVTMASGGGYDYNAICRWSRQATV